MMPLDFNERILIELLRARIHGGALDARVSDWRGLLAAAERHKLAPLLYVAMKDSGQLSSAPATLQGTLFAAYVQSHAASECAMTELLAIHAELARAQIPLVLLKGAALANTLYADRALRPFGDLDLLIAREHITAVSELLRARGYQPEPEPAPNFHRRFLHEQLFSRTVPSASEVDVHWHLFGSAYYRRRADIKWFWQRTLETPIGGQALCVLAPEAQLLHLCAHMLLHHRYTRLLWSHDIALLLARESERINWDDVLAAARAFRLVRVMQSALAQVGALWQVSAPRAVALQLSAMPADAMQQTMFRLATARRAEPLLVADTLFIRGARSKFWFWWHKAWPSAPYMRRWAGAAAAQPLPLTYARRLLATPLHLWRALRSAR